MRVIIDTLFIIFVIDPQIQSRINLMLRWFVCLDSFLYCYWSLRFYSLNLGKAIEGLALISYLAALVDPSPIPSLSGTKSQFLAYPFFWNLPCYVSCLVLFSSVLFWLTVDILWFFHKIFVSFECAYVRLWDLFPELDYMSSTSNILKMKFNFVKEHTCHVKYFKLIFDNV